MASVMLTAVRAAVTLLAIAGAAGHIAYLDALWWHSLGLTETVARDVGSALITLLAAHAVVSIVCGFLGVALVLREGPRQDAARGLGAAFGSWSYLMAYSGVTMLFRPDPGLGRDIFEGHFLLVEVIGLAGLLRFTALFPKPLIAERIEASPTMPRALMPGHLVSLWMLRPTAPWIVGFLLLVGLWMGMTMTGRPISDAGLSPVMDVFRLGAAGLVVLNLRRAWVRASGEERDRLTWLAASLAFLFGSLALMIGGNVLVAVTGFPEPTVAWRPILLDLGLIGFLVGLAQSILYKGSGHPIRMVRRVTSVSAVLTMGLFLAAGLEALFASGVLAAFTLRGGVGTAVAVATIVSTYRALTRRIERLLPEP